MITIAIYEDGVFKRTREFPGVYEMREAFAGRSESLTLRRVIVEPTPVTTEEQYAVNNDPVLEDGPDAETGLPILRYTYSVEEFSPEQKTTFRLAWLETRYAQAQEANVPDQQSTQILAAAVHVLCREAQQAGILTALSAAETAAVTRANTDGKDILDNFVKYQTLKAQIEAGQNPDITTGWAE